MKKVLLFFLLISPAFGQRYDNFASTLASASGIGNLMQAIPNPTITVCNFPGTGGTPCTNKATTYTNQTLLTSCALGTQVVLQGSSTCQATGDVLGNFGFWAPPGKYQYCISATNFTTQCYNALVPVDPTGASPVNSVLYVGGNISTWSGADLGAQLNAAYAALPSTGGRIRILSSSTTYTMSTAFSATTAGKPVLIECDPGGATLINWTPTTGTAFTFDTKLNSNQHPVGMGMRDCFLQTSGAASSIAINLGNTNSAEGYTIQNVNFQAFTTGVTITGGGLTGSFSNLFLNDVFRSITTCLSAINSPEMIKVIATTFFACGTAITGTADWTVIGGSCDDPGAGGCLGNTSTVSWFGPHFENPGLGAPTYVNSSGIVRIYGGVALDDVNSGTLASSWFSNTGIDDLIIDGLEISTAGRTMSGATPVVSFGANGHGALRVYNKNSLSPLYTPNAFQFNFISDESYNSSGTLIAAIPGPIKQVEMSSGCPQSSPGATNILCASINDFLYHQNLNNNTYGDQHVPIALSLGSQYTNSTTGFTTVTSFTAAASTTYTVSCHLYYQAAATGGLNIEWTGPASPTAVHYGLLLPITTGTAPISTEADAYSTSLGTAIGTAATNFDAILSFTLVNGANAGTVTLLAKSSAAVQLQIQIGSFCQVQ